MFALMVYCTQLAGCQIERQTGWRTKSQKCKKWQQSPGFSSPRDQASYCLYFYTPQYKEDNITLRDAFFGVSKQNFMLSNINDTVCMQQQLKVKKMRVWGQSCDASSGFLLFIFLHTPVHMLPCLFGQFWPFLDQMAERRKKTFSSTRPVSFAACKIFSFSDLFSIHRTVQKPSTSSKSHKTTKKEEQTIILQVWLSNRSLTDQKNSFEVSTFHNFKQAMPCKCSWW